MSHCSCLPHPPKNNSSGKLPPPTGTAKTEVVVAVYKSASAAETATSDLEGARVPTATIRQFVSDPAADEQLLEVRNQGTTSGHRIVAVTVDASICSPLAGPADSGIDAEIPACRQGDIRMISGFPLAGAGGASTDSRARVASPPPAAT
jgi:hypothetical protein